MQERKKNYNESQREMDVQFDCIQKWALKHDISMVFKHAREVCRLIDQKRKSHIAVKQADWSVNGRSTSPTVSIKDILSEEKQEELLSEIKKKAFS